ncbi:hypothetical protein [Nonomuraea guangzhouensis]|uniref:Uncharacterized protein n=1 Tax=Nonomuraea guangzhouensis TaxID=1291555 RepID=A0ABW4GNX5_9ACTN|nr:hypothetical protein [Nonomuraea guangzhouensis]
MAMTTFRDERAADSRSATERISACGFIRPCVGGAVTRHLVSFVKLALIGG